MEGFFLILVISALIASIIIYLIAFIDDFNEKLVYISLGIMSGALVITMCCGLYYGWDSHPIDGGRYHHHHYHCCHYCN